MELSPEERRRIYEEEKARVDAEQQKQRMAEGGSTTGLEPNIAGLLCYLGGWITGIVFLAIEQKSKFVRFHALQSIITFGALTVVGAFLNWIPLIGSFISAAIGILAFILWILLMIKAHQGELYKIPLAGQVAEGILPTTWREAKPETGEEPKPSKAQKTETKEASALALEKKMDKFGKRIDEYFTGSRAGRIAGYSAAIFWNVVFLVFFSFFHH
ncbi:DUF4870 domain-containing protein, partial [Chloroflexota bacterium]